VEPLLKSSGFVNVAVKLKEESREFIKNWLPGSGCEKYVVSADITARKPQPAITFHVAAEEPAAEVSSVTAEEAEAEAGC